MQTFRELMNRLLSAHRRIENQKEYCDECWSSVEKKVFFITFVLAEIFFYL